MTQQKKIDEVRTNNMEINPRFTHITGHGPTAGLSGFRSKLVIQKNRLETETYRVIGSVDTGPGAGVISKTFLLESAPLDHKINNEVPVKATGGFSKFKVVAA